MVSVCTMPIREGMSSEHFGGYKTINRIPFNDNNGNNNDNAIKIMIINE